MKAILFSGVAMLDQRDTRQSLIRIPEVIQKIKQAQTVIDQLTNFSFDLHNCMHDDNQFLTSNPKIRRVLVNVVQLALYERHIKSYHKPHFFVGSLFNLSAIEHCLGFSYFDEFIRSVWFQDLEGSENEEVVFETQSKYQDIQKVHQLYNKKNNYYIYEFQQMDDTITEAKKMDEADSCEKILSKLISKYEVKQVVNLAPSDMMLSPIANPFLLEDIQLFNTIEIDPMLSWFYQRFAC
jgi:hypothetical protein